jgi:formate/nitrite transporter FocA (FNT family)
MVERGGHNAIDALLPREMAEKAEHVGVDKTRLDFTSLIVLAILAGAFIAFGSMFSVVVTADADGVLPYGVMRLLAGVVFSLGLILVIVGGAELFTGNFPNLSLLASLANLFWVTLGNMIGGVLVGITYWFVYLRTRGVSR